MIRAFARPVRRGRLGGGARSRRRGSRRRRRRAANGRAGHATRDRRDRCPGRPPLASWPGSRARARRLGRGPGQCGAARRRAGGRGSRARRPPRGERRERLGPARGRQRSRRRCNWVSLRLARCSSCSPGTPRPATSTLRRWQRSAFGLLTPCGRACTHAPSSSSWVARVRCSESSARRSRNCRSRTRSRRRSRASASCSKPTAWPSTYARTISLYAAAGLGLAGPHARLAERLLDLTLGPFRSRGMLVVDDVSADQRLSGVADAAAEAGIEAAIAVPLLARDEVIGLLGVFPPPAASSPRTSRHCWPRSPRSWRWRCRTRSCTSARSSSERSGNAPSKPSARRRSRCARCTRSHVRSRRACRSKRRSRRWRAPSSRSSESTSRSFACPTSAASTWCRGR